MPIPIRITRFNRRFLNPAMLRLAGRGSLVDLEHVGRRSGRTYHTPLMAFRSADPGRNDRDSVTVALTYGPDVEWLRNVRHAGGARMRMRGQILTLGAPRDLDPDEALRRITMPQRALLRWPVRCRDYIEMPVLTARP